MKKLIACIMVPCFIFMIGCSNTGDNASKKVEDSGKQAVDENVQTPPELEVIISDTTQKALLQRYDWTFKESNNNDKNEVKTLIDEQDVVKTAPSVTVSSANKLGFKFTTKPDSYTVKMILPNEVKLEIVNDEVNIPVPSSLGQATFKVEGKWKEGTATYMFNIDIQG